VQNPSARFPHQPALDGIRALAVAAVLAFHGGVAAVSGGFLGVDAFFVLSGFLITSLLLAEHAGAGRINLVAFWGRRARRLLPALLLVLLAVVVVSRWLLPRDELGALRLDALAAVAYVANWRMMNRGGGYFAETAAPSPLQHTWSLGIEEQFYLLWPLLVVGLLAVAVRRGAQGRTALLAVCLLGATASALAAAVLFDPADVDRAYYGTDTRALALLIGCALAVLLAGRATEPAGDVAVRVSPGLYAATVRTRRPHRVLGSLALAGAVGTGWLWATADGSAAWLYRGGLVAAALAVAAVIAHAVVSPASPTARLLALPPLTWLGRVSYGVYLWHWPLFGWLTADRTGLTGLPLLTVRCAVTLAVAAASYYLMERPIRTARWVRRPRLAPALAAGAMAATAAAAMVATVPPPVPPPPPIALDEALAVPSSGPRAGAGAKAAPPTPMQRRGRKPGKQPRITFFGDSVSWSLSTYLPEQDKLVVRTRGVPGCGIARLPDIRYIGLPHTNYPGCDQWDRRWRRNVKSDDPDVAVLLLDRWELMDRRLGGRYRHVGQPDFDAYLNKELDLAISIMTSRGAHLVILTAPYTRRAERPDGGLWPEDQPQRVDAWNRLLRAAAQRHKATVIDLNKRVCPDGKFTWQVGDVRIRSDGLHFTPEGVRQVIAPWLLPKVARLAVRGPQGA
jgi:peptidoglycan/LPS O-acetylase OafA/YrhL